MAKNIYDIDQALANIKNPGYSSGQAASLLAALDPDGIGKGLSTTGTAIQGIGTDLQKYATDQAAAQLAAQSRAGMQIDPLTGQPIDPTGQGVAELMAQARTAQQNVDPLYLDKTADRSAGFNPNFDLSNLSGMVDFKSLSDRADALGKDRRDSAEELRKVAKEKRDAAAEVQLRSLDQFKRDEARLKNKRNNQIIQIAEFKEQRNALLDQLKLEEGAQRLEFADENNEQKIKQIKAQIEKLNIEITYKEDELVAGIESTEAATALQKLELRTKERALDKQEEADQHELIEDGQIETYNAFAAQSSQEGWIKLKEIMQQNYQEGVAQPRLVALANQYLANNLDPTESITPAEIAQLKGSRSAAARNKLVNTISKRLKEKYKGLIPPLSGSKEFNSTIKSQAERMVNSNEISTEFTEESLYAKRGLPERLKNQVKVGVANLQLAMENLRKTNAPIQDQITELDKRKIALTQITDKKGIPLVNVKAAEKLIQPIRDRILDKRNDLVNLETFNIKTTNSQGKVVERPLNLERDLGISRLDLRLGKNPQGRELASFKTFEAKLDEALAQDSRLYNTSPEARARKKRSILQAIHGYSTVKTAAVKTQTAKEMVEEVKMKSPKLQEEAKQKFMVSFRTNKFPTADIARQLINNFPAQYDKDNITSTDVEADVQKTYENMKELYKNQWAVLDDNGRILAVENQDALDDLGYAVYRLYSAAEGKPMSFADYSPEITSGSIPETKGDGFNWFFGVDVGSWLHWEDRVSISELSKDPDLFSSIIQRSGVFPKARFKPSSTQKTNQKATDAAKTLGSYQLP